MLRMKKLEGVLRIIDAISEKTGKFATGLLLVTTVIIVYHVLMRYVFGSPTRFVFDVSKMLWGAYLLLVMAWTHKEGGHVSLDIIYNRFSPRMRLMLDLVFCVALALLWVGAVTAGGIAFAERSWAIREGTKSPWAPPIYPVKTVLPIAFAILGLQCLAKFSRDLITLIRSKA